MIHFFEVEEWERQPIIDVFGDQAILTTEALTPGRTVECRDCSMISIFIYSKIDKQVLDRMPRLEMIATRSTGYEHIDLDECSRRGITVTHIPRYGDETVAEHTFALILALAKNIVPSVDRTRRGEFSFKGLRGIDITGKTLGIIGTGKIGQNVAKIAKGFSMRLIAYDKYPNRKAADELGISYLDYDDVLKASDVLTYHVPDVPETHHMLNVGNISLLKPNCIVINTSRGAVIETRALVRALSEDKIAGAGLDVVEEEPVIREERELVSSLFQRTHQLEAILSGQILLRFNNVIITPHNAFNTNEAVMRILDTTFENIRSYQAGEVVNEVPVPAKV